MLTGKRGARSTWHAYSIAQKNGIRSGIKRLSKCPYVGAGAGWYLEEARLFIEKMEQDISEGVWDPTEEENVEEAIEGNRDSFNAEKARLREELKVNDPDYVCYESEQSEDEDWIIGKPKYDTPAAGKVRAACASSSKSPGSKKKSGGKNGEENAGGTGGPPPTGEKRGVGRPRGDPEEIRQNKNAKNRERNRLKALGLPQSEIKKRIKSFTRQKTPKVDDKSQDSW